MADGKIVKIRAFTYHVEGEHPYDPDSRVLSERMAMRDEEIPEEDLRDYDLERGERLDVLYSDEEAEELRAEWEADAETDKPEEADPGYGPEGEVEGEARTDVPDDLDFAEASEDEIQVYLETHQPNADTTLSKAVDKETAERILAAEQGAGLGPNGKPRKSVVEGLQAIIDSG